MTPKQISHTLKTKTSVCPHGRVSRTNDNIGLRSLFDQDFRGVERSDNGLDVRPASFDELHLLVVANEADDLVVRMLLNEAADHTTTNEASNAGDENGRRHCCCVAP